MPAPLGSQLSFVWARVAGLETRLGQQEKARASLRAAAEAHAQFVVQAPEGSARRTLLERSPDTWRARRELWLGNDEAALATSKATIERVHGIASPVEDLRAEEIRANLLRFSLATAVMAAIGLGQHAEAESLSRTRLGVPPAQTGDVDPQDETSRATVALAHAIAMQNRSSEALGILKPVLEGYRAEPKRTVPAVRLFNVTCSWL